MCKIQWVPCVTDVTYTLKTNKFWKFKDTIGFGYFCFSKAICASGFTSLSLVHIVLTKVCFSFDDEIKFSN